MANLVLGRLGGRQSSRNPALDGPLGHVIACCNLRRGKQIDAEAQGRCRIPDLVTLMPLLVTLVSLLPRISV